MIIKILDDEPRYRDEYICDECEKTMTMGVPFTFSGGYGSWGYDCTELHFCSPYCLEEGIAKVLIKEREARGVRKIPQTYT